MNLSNKAIGLRKPGTFRRALRAFTLIEMLLVITIIALLAALGLPHLKGWGESNSMTAATRQLMDDLSFARLKAINSRSTVYVVFISPEIATTTFLNNPALTAAQKKQAMNLFSGQYTTYALFTRRQVGEQPGRENPKYLTQWKSLPEKVFIGTNKFTTITENVRFANYTETNRPFATNDFPFPNASDATVARLPFIAFNSRGQLISEKNAADQYEGATIPLARGSVFYARDRDGNLIVGPADPVETPPQNSLTNYNNIRIDWLTGRTRVERREF